MVVCFPDGKLSFRQRALEKTCEMRLRSFSLSPRAIYSLRSIGLRESSGGADLRSLMVSQMVHRKHVEPVKRREQSQTAHSDDKKETLIGEPSYALLFVFDDDLKILSLSKLFDCLSCGIAWARMVFTYVEIDVLALRSCVLSLKFLG